MNPIKDLRDLLYSLVDGIDVSDIIPTGWEEKSKHPPKQIVCPMFWVEPVSNTTQALDSISNETTHTLSVILSESYEDSPLGEDTTIELADRIYLRLLRALKNPSTLTGMDAMLEGTPSGQWGWDEKYGARFYRIDVSFRVVEPITPA